MIGNCDGGRFMPRVAPRIKQNIVRCVAHVIHAVDDRACAAYA